MTINPDCPYCTDPLYGHTGHGCLDKSGGPIEADALAISCDCGGVPHGRGCALVLNGLEIYEEPVNVLDELNPRLAPLPETTA